MASGAKQSFTLWWVLAGLAVAVGTWNYQRNAAAEDAVIRPYRGLSNADLEQLSAAYEEEIAALDSHYQVVAARRPTVRRAIFTTEKVREFERVQKVGQATRDLGSKRNERRAELERVRREVELRSRRGGELQVMLRRVFTL
ncbi:MAG: hypothetical protein HRU01_14930 [Myxococcales bacterium]|nr:hypothetical protein [Myxococcales bacterium]